MSAIQLASATLGGVLLLAGPSSETTSKPDFDPLFDAGSRCGSATGRPLLLERMILAQAETRPFQPGRQLSSASASQPAAPLYQDLGGLQVRVTTESPRAQAYFNQGVRLVFSFNHAEATRAFRAAQQADPNCAMCYWGEALALGPNINAPMFPDAITPAAAAAARALALAPRTTPPEQALIRAIALRYADPAPADRTALDQAYADAMATAARAFPADDTTQVLYAEALMDLSPWNYWDAGGSQPRANTAELVSTLERVLERNRSHPGAIHYYIHAMEASNHPEKALPYARQLAKQIPGAGHIVHMPSHVYYRLGMYRDALQSNVDAVATDEKYFRRATSDPVYKGAYYTHNIHFVMVSALMGGDGKTALAAGAKLDREMTRELVKEFAMMQPVKAAPYFAHVQFSSPDAVLALPDPGPDMVVVKAMWHYARAIAYARKGALAQSRMEIDTLGEMERGADFKAVTDWGVPAKEIVQTAHAVASGRLADAQGNLAAAVAAYRKAVAIQDSLPYTEPPHWYYPVRQSLGAALLRSGKLDEAEEVFRASLARTPSNGWALSGLMAVYRERGDRSALAATQKRFHQTWLGKRGEPALSLL